MLWLYGYLAIAAALLCAAVYTNRPNALEELWVMLGMALVWPIVLTREFLAWRGDKKRQQARVDAWNNALDRWAKGEDFKIRVDYDKDNESQTR